MKDQKTLRNLIILALTICTHACTDKEVNEVENTDLTWTYTYLKAKQNHKEDLKETIIKNWFAMDSVAKARGLINDYELIENISQVDSTSWDFIVAVAYYTEGNYADIAEDFEKISQAHETVKVNGLSFPEVGSVTGSELVKKIK